MNVASNVAVDSVLLEEAVRFGGHRTKKDAVAAALKEYIQRRKQARILELFGKVQFDTKYDYERQRRRPVGSAKPIVPRRRCGRT